MSSSETNLVWFQKQNLLVYIIVDLVSFPGSLLLSGKSLGTRLLCMNVRMLWVC